MSLEAFTKAYYEKVKPHSVNRVAKSYGQTFNANPGMQQPKNEAYKNPSNFSVATRGFGKDDHEDFRDHHLYEAGKLWSSDQKMSSPDNRLAAAHEKASNMHAAAMGKFR